MAKKKTVAKRKPRTAPPVSANAANRRLVRKWFDQVWNKQRAETIDAMLSPTCIAHGKAADGGDAIGPGVFREFHKAYLGAFPDLKVSVEDVVAEGGKAAVRWVATGTHQGGTLGFPATGKTIRMQGMSFVKIKGGRIVEGWDSYDQHGMLQQLGITTAPVGSRAL
jgi:steroid delta-isomerase-like uncharacterized protein